MNRKTKDRGYEYDTLKRGILSSVILIILHQILHSLDFVNKSRLVTLVTNSPRARGCAVIGIGPIVVLMETGYYAQVGAAFWAMVLGFPTENSPAFIDGIPAEVAA